MNVAEYKKVQAYVSLEYQDAVLLADYLAELQLKGHVSLYSHLPHETYTSSWKAKMRNKRQGVRRGVPDYIVILKDMILFIELKRAHGGTLSPEQKEWQQELEGKVARAFVAKGFHDAKRIIDTFLPDPV